MQRIALYLAFALLLATLPVAYYAGIPVAQWFADHYPASPLCIFALFVPSLACLAGVAILMRIAERA